MKRKLAIAVAIFMGGVSCVTLAQEGSIGRDEYNNNCASCHGISGKGDGPFSEYIKKGAPSLTTLSKNNGGVFPFDRVFKIIDGRGGVRGHGTSEMPVWGKEYTAKTVATHGPFFGEFYAEDVVRARILALIDHLHSLQEK